ncbi:MAG: 2-amino-4-hydroxy-6-hydroxymethyldihydropteridine diphosphokinase [Candidatus Omnitrophica bacterium]|nr:2-amino-4-hydroxy-6-hydroxymethyldihydropteridine diphosphokinase [Candidatus Omnitrophota bacterium]
MVSISLLAEKKLKKVYLGVGSNIGLREEHLKKAKILISYHPKIKFLRAAPVYKTEPVGGPTQGKFLNTVWEIETELSPRDLLQMLLSTERSLGRAETREKNTPRTIDLDILFYDDLTLQEADLTIPHPKISERWFVLKPLWDLASELIHPILGKSVCQMLDECHESY